MGLQVFGIVKESITDGAGIRYTIFVQGCKHACPGCHNPESHSMSGGYNVDINELVEDIGKNKLIDGLTISGGDPLFQVDETVELLKKVKQNSPHLNVWLYTGYMMDDIMRSPSKSIILSYIDILVDGRYEQDKRDLAASFKGSTNQRIIKVKETLEEGKLVLWEN